MRRPPLGRLRVLLLVSTTGYQIVLILALRGQVVFSGSWRHAIPAPARGARGFGNLTVSEYGFEIAENLTKSVLAQVSDSALFGGLQRHGGPESNFHVPLR